MQTIVLYLCYIVLILLFSTAYNTSLIYCFVIWCLHTNKRRPCSSTLSGHPSSSLIILQRAATHKYLGRLIVGNLKKRSKIEPAHRLQIAWAKFRTNKHVRCLDQPSCFLKVATEILYFDTMISPVVLFGLASLPFCATPDASCNCWLGSCGWQRLEGQRLEGHHAQSER